MIANTEEEIARFYDEPDSLVVLCEHRSFTVSVIRKGQRVRELTKRFLATDGDSAAAKCFPAADGFHHYRDDFDYNFFIANVSNFNFHAHVDDPSKRLLTRSKDVQTQDAVSGDDMSKRSNGFNRAHQNARNHKRGLEDTNTAPTAVPKSESDSDREAKSQSEGGFYYKAKHALQTEDISAAIEFHERYGAPFWAKSQMTSPTRCFSHNDLVSAVNETLAEC